MTGSCTGAPTTISASRPSPRSMPAMCASFGPPPSSRPGSPRRSRTRRSRWTACSIWRPPTTRSRPGTRSPASSSGPTFRRWAIPISAAARSRAASPSPMARCSPPRWTACRGAGCAHRQAGLEERQGQCPAAAGLFLFLHHRAHRLQWPGAGGQCRRRMADARLYGSAGCQDRQAGLALQHHRGARSARRQHLERRELEIWRRLGVERARHRPEEQSDPVRGGQSQSGPGWLQPQGRQRLYRLHRRHRFPHRQDPLVVPAGGARHLGL